MNRYHCCATCVHFGISKAERHVVYRCVRLGFETKPAYQFKCWTPKQEVKALMDKRE